MKNRRLLTWVRSKSQKEQDEIIRLFLKTIATIMDERRDSPKTVQCASSNTIRFSHN